MRPVPELPEVETMRRGVLHAVGGRIASVDRPPCAKRPLAIHPGWDEFHRRVEGRSIVEIGRLGKRVIFKLDDEMRVVFEPRMTGLVLVAQPPTVEHLRLRLTLAGVAEPEILFWDRRGLGVLHALDPHEFAQQLGPHKLGPDALEITFDELRAKFKKVSRPVKVALLDQQLLAGVGNLYAAEILHVARIHPERPTDRLTTAEVESIHAAMQAVLNEAIRYEGSTLSDGTYRNALNQDGGYQNQHRVYDKAGATCRVCTTTEIVRIVQAQRSTFYCPTCQPKRPAAARKRVK
ncbi:MAG TPA: bifunctional DNA-formamidopyrimidine glycosylase/DNA-(apurinic or apyrimidinic site) lyase [Pirellulales bacterium]